jgi:cytidylate kinase
MPDRIHEKLIQRQLSHWSRLQTALRPGEGPAQQKPLPVVTISRQAGCGSREQAEALGQRLGLQVFGKEIVEHIARDKDLTHEVVNALDERVASKIEQWVRGMLDRRFFLQDDYHLALVRTVRTLAAHGGVIFMGRGANFILADSVDLRVRLVATEDWRVRSLAVRHQISEDEALIRVRDLEAQRAAFVRRLFRADVDDPRHYDLVLNIARLGPALPEIIAAALAQRERLADAAEARS